jgi:hypothetical protein
MQAVEIPTVGQFLGGKVDVTFNGNNESDDQHNGDRKHKKATFLEEANGGIDHFLGTPWSVFRSVYSRARPGRVSSRKSV